ncbi:MAG: SPASM domain-containing protein [Lachnospiraceae bacterium]|nr:SPASM domain-containing protein [Lachnospiraceae bacterium]
MSIRIVNFAGIIGWNARKYLPHLASKAYLAMQFALREKKQRQFIEQFMSEERAPYPDVVNIETINRCNSNCAFCTANRFSERRPFAKIEDGLYYSVIDQLAEWGYPNKLTLYGNNEPWLDKRIVEFHKYAREKLPKVYIFMSTNGLLLDIDKVDSIVPYVNQLIINNYCEDMKLHENIKIIYDHVKAHPDKYKDVDILIQMRYVKEVLTNRAGSAPNRQNEKPKEVRHTCVMPYTDVWIEPNGNMGICCCDNFETTSMGDLSKEKLVDIWNGPKYKELREKVRYGRHNYPFCRYCDFIDAGLRGNIVKEELSKKQG